jgi:response regulator RpfG family c-di-GMP phosphodiesterase
MMAALVERRLAVKAMELGASDYVVKPFEMEDLVMRIRSALEKRRLLLENRTYKQQVHEHAEEYSRQLRHHMLLEQRRAVELGEALSALKRAYDSTVETLALALDVRSPLMVGHTRRVAAYTMEMARSMDIGNAELETIGYGAMLHDVGDVAVPEQILNKPTRLDEAELDVMKKHVAFGSRLLNHVDFLRDASAMVLHHHERHDGRGYPGGLAGDRIVRGARIFAVADAFDAMTSPRPYRGPLSYDDACAELIRCSGNHFDPSVVEAFFTVPRTRWVDLRQQAELAVKQWHGEC